jgi:hypothetical protein
MNTEAYAQRRWVGWLVVFSTVGLLVAKAGGFLPAAEAASGESTTLLVLAPLAKCGQPNQVGAYRSGEMACRPVLVWNLTDLARHLAPLNVLAEGETLVTPPGLAAGPCPFLVMHGRMAVGARVCFTPRGGLYRDSGGAHDDQWSWRVTPGGQWVLDRTGW